MGGTIFPEHQSKLQLNSLTAQLNVLPNILRLLSKIMLFYLIQRLENSKLLFLRWISKTKSGEGRVNQPWSSWENIYSIPIHSLVCFKAFTLVFILTFLIYAQKVLQNYFLHRKNNEKPEGHGSSISTSFHVFQQHQLLRGRPFGIPIAHSLKTFLAFLDFAPCS